MITVNNLYSGRIAIDNLTLEAGGVGTIPALTSNFINAIAQGFISVSPTLAQRTLATITDSSGGTPSNVLAAMGAGATYLQADHTAAKNAIASLAAQLNVAKLAIDDLKAELVSVRDTLASV